MHEERIIGLDYEAAEARLWHSLRTSILDRYMVHYTEARMWRVATK